MKGRHLILTRQPMTCNYPILYRQCRNWFTAFVVTCDQLSTFLSYVFHTSIPSNKPVYFLNIATQNASFCITSKGGTLFRCLSFTLQSYRQRKAGCLQQIGEIAHCIGSTSLSSRIVYSPTLLLVGDVNCQLAITNGRKTRHNIYLRQLHVKLPVQCIQISTVDVTSVEHRPRTECSLVTKLTSQMIVVIFHLGYWMYINTIQNRVLLNVCAIVHYRESL